MFQNSSGIGDDNEMEVGKREAKSKYWQEHQK